MRDYSYRTEQTYVDWIKRYILFHQKRHPKDMGEDEIRTFLAYLAVERHVSASTQKQALNAILFLYRHVLNQPLEVPDVIRPERPRHLPTVLSHAEALTVIGNMRGVYQLMTKLLYGGGLRLTPALAP